MGGLLAVAAALAASWDGKWVFETKNKKQDAGVQTTLVLKTEGDAVKGIVTTGGKRRDRTADIKDAKIEGNQIRFATVNRNKKGEHKIAWTATLEGDQLRGTQSRAGAKRSLPFTAKRQN
jgi:hypothetical protein